MILNSYSLFDSKSGTFSPPFFCLSRGIAIRMVMDIMADQNTTPARYPDDFTLFELGNFDDATGVIISSAPINLGVVSAFRTDAGGQRQ